MPAKYRAPHRQSLLILADPENVLANAVCARGGTAVADSVLSQLDPVEARITNIKPHRVHLLLWLGDRTLAYNLGATMETRCGKQAAMRTCGQPCLH